MHSAALPISPSLGIFVGGLSALAPSRKGVVGTLAWRVPFAGFHRCLLAHRAMAALLRIHRISWPRERPVHNKNLINRQFKAIG